MYTMAANAVIRLIDQYDVDPSRVKFLALGTESSTDNSAGAIIVKGMVDEALAVRGLPPISRSCEVPEFKHACLGGVYGMKGAIRHLALDGAGSQAIVVCADIAEYARGASADRIGRRLTTSRTSRFSTASIRRRATSMKHCRR